MASLRDMLTRFVASYYSTYTCQFMHSHIYSVQQCRDALHAVLLGVNLSFVFRERGKVHVVQAIVLQ